MSSPSASAFTPATKSLTTWKLTSASSSARRISRIALLTASSSSRLARPRSPRVAWSRSERASNTAVKCTGGAAAALPTRVAERARTGDVGRQRRARRSRSIMSMSGANRLCSGSIRYESGSLTSWRLERRLAAGARRSSRPPRGVCQTSQTLTAPTASRRDVKDQARGRIRVELERDHHRVVAARESARGRA